MKVRPCWFEFSVLYIFDIIGHHSFLVDGSLDDDGCCLSEMMVTTWNAFFCIKQFIFYCIGPLA